MAIGGAVVAKCGLKPSKYFIGIDKVVVDGASLGFGTFVLFWTLFYNICHLFYLEQVCLSPGLGRD